MSLKLLLLFNFGLAAVLTGLIWTIQLVHYPSFGLVGKAEFIRFHAAHTARMGYLVAPLMVLELGLSLWLAGAARHSALAGPAAWALALVGLIWAVTFFISVPFHNRLAAGFDYIAIDGLTRTNWLRTLAWTTRLLVLGWVVFKEQ
ncbi:hypothetical protein [uncultured Hymenobacter sp.]|uniref:hypothetical protein n=1 Tax=uncultured Hymenobacter sp. TaxID=170016 RepID=UPI0035C9A318